MHLFHLERDTKKIWIYCSFILFLNYFTGKNLDEKEPAGVVCYSLAFRVLGVSICHRMKPDHLPAFRMPLQLLHIYLIFPPTCLQINYNRQWSGLGIATFNKMHSNLYLPIVLRFLCNSWDESLCLLLFGHQSCTPLQIWLIFSEKTWMQAESDEWRRRYRMIML